MLKKKLAAVGITLTTALSLVACSHTEEADGTWKGKSEILEISDGHVKMSSTDEKNPFSVDGEVDYKNQEIIVSYEAVWKSLKSGLTEEEAKQVDELAKQQKGDNKDVQRTKYTIDGDKMTIDNVEYTRQK